MIPIFHPVVQELVDLIALNNWEADFQAAIAKAHSYHIPELSDLTNLAEYLQYINQLLYWVPSEDVPGKEVYNRICKFYFILDQEPVVKLQNAILPSHAPDKEPAPTTELSAWMVRYAQAMGEFLDTPESLTAESLNSFYDSPNYNMDDYLVPHGGWKTFNQFFARNFKPGYRPVAAVSDPTVIVSPADSTFAGQWEIRPNSQVTVKNLHWTIQELLEGSPYKDRFTNGLFMHAFLNTTDYHRQHAPVDGKVLEARVIPGRVYLDVVADPVAGATNGAHTLKMVRHTTTSIFDAQDNLGYQFAQARGLIVLDSPIGLVAILPMGMAQVSSVILTAEVGVTLRKGEEISYFQFGGSDIIVLFESASNVSFTAQPNVHYKVGTRLAQAFPVR